MHLVIDEGNTACKYAVFNALQTLVHQEIAPAFSLVKVKELHSKFNFTKGILSSVRNTYSALELAFDFPMLLFSVETKVPIEIAYHDFSKLGLDRLAAAVALKHTFPKEAALSIGMGTCIIYDLVNPDGIYLGGLISPGLQMRLDAMHSFTARLPSIQFNMEEIPGLPAFTTSSSMLSGTLYGIVGELEKIISEFRVQYPELKIVLTGGNSLYFEKRLKESTFANPNFILEGLNIILNYNVLQ